MDFIYHIGTVGMQSRSQAQMPVNVSWEDNVGNMVSKLDTFAHIIGNWEFGAKV